MRQRNKEREELSSSESEDRLVEITAMEKNKEK